MTPFHHARSSVRKFGGKWEDYIEIHEWFDESKAYFPNFRHRALRHHTLGIQDCIRIFGRTIKVQHGDLIREIPVQLVAEQHVMEDCRGIIPKPSDWLLTIKREEWMQPSREDVKEVCREEEGTGQAQAST
jgi:hypothetical protein